MIDEVSAALVNATQGVLLDYTDARQHGTPLRVQKRETSNESMYAFTLSSSAFLLTGLFVPRVGLYCILLRVVLRRCSASSLGQVYVYL